MISPHKFWECGLTHVFQVTVVHIVKLMIIWILQCCHTTIVFLQKTFLLLKPFPLEKGMWLWICLISAKTSFLQHWKDTGEGGNGSLNWLDDLLYLPFWWLISYRKDLECIFGVCKQHWWSKESPHCLFSRAKRSYSCHKWAVEDSPGIGKSLIGITGSMPFPHRTPSWPIPL